MADKLHPNVGKTEFMPVRTRQRLAKLEEKPALRIGGNEINCVIESKKLGVVVDENPNWYY